MMQDVPTPTNPPPLRMQLHIEVMMHVLLLVQHAPEGQHGLGVQAPPGVNEILGGTGQSGARVCVQVPIASQHAPLTWQGLGVQVPLAKKNWLGWGHIGVVTGKHRAVSTSQQTPANGGGPQGLGVQVVPAGLVMPPENWHMAASVR